VDRVAQLRDEMRAGLELVEAAKQPMPVGDAWLLHRIDPFDASSVVLVGPRPDQLDRVLLRSRDLPGPRPTIEWVVPSPTGTHVAVGISVDGGEDATARVVEVAGGEMLPDAVPHVFVFPLSWLADGSGFYACVRWRGGPPRLRRSVERRPHRGGCRHAATRAVPRRDLRDPGDRPARSARTRRRIDRHRVRQGGCGRTPGRVAAHLPAATAARRGAVPGSARRPG
jgi:hypothetical protein